MDKNLKATVEFLLWIFIIISIYIFIRNAPYDNFLFHVLKIRRVQQDIIYGILHLTFFFASYLIGEFLLYKRFSQPFNKKVSYAKFFVATVLLSSMLSVVSLFFPSSSEPQTGDVVGFAMALVIYPVLFGLIASLYCSFRIIISKWIEHEKGIYSNATLIPLFYKLRYFIRFMAIFISIFGLSAYIYDYQTQGRFLHLSENSNSLAITYKALELNDIEYCKYADMPRNRFCNFYENITRKCDRTWTAMHFTCFPTYLANQTQDNNLDSVISGKIPIEKYRKNICNDLSEAMEMACYETTSAIISKELENVLIKEIPNFDIKLEQPEFQIYSYPYPYPNPIIKRYYGFGSQSIFSSESERISPQGKDYFKVEKVILSATEPGFLDILDDESKSLIEKLNMSIEEEARIPNHSWYVRMYVMAEKIIEVGPNEFISLVNNKFQHTINNFEQANNEGATRSKLEEPEINEPLICKDSDSGKNYYLKGTTCHTLPDGSQTCFDDECNTRTGSGNVLYEHYCEGNEIKREFIHCECNEGVCN